MSTRIPTQARSRATVEAILGGTRRVLASRGYAGTTTNHIAEAAGVSIGSFYQYFADKDAAVAAYADQFAQETLAFAASHVGESNEGSTVVAAWLTALSIHACDQAALVRVLFQEVPYLWSLPGFRDAMAGTLTVVEQLVGDEQAHDRAFVILKSAIAVIIEVAADPALRARRAAIIDELALMIDSYLAATSF